MTTITIPKKTAKNKELVAVPRSVYEDFLAWQKMVKSARTFRPTIAQKKELQRARKDYKDGKYLTIHEFRKKLARSY